ncbi:BspA family leucine-rich repeat surface protein [[Acholeplasma] multilocale]|uniref:BspA family leucine-rich repeat surface protein n=1 Tax=[Acholeplasma] multilocale TaxID=264638 RepID=UPI000685CC0F|nr:BspA family leucine-rich repeat surface protein [[Acholeplasma] multilocale]
MKKLFMLASAFILLSTPVVLMMLKSDVKLEQKQLKHISEISDELQEILNQRPETVWEVQELQSKVQEDFDKMITVKTIQTKTGIFESGSTGFIFKGNGTLENDGVYEGEITLTQDWSGIKDTTVHISEIKEELQSALVGLEMTTEEIMFNITEQGIEDSFIKIELVEEVESDDGLYKTNSYKFTGEGTKYNEGKYNGDIILDHRIIYPSESIYILNGEEARGFEIPKEVTEVIFIGYDGYGKAHKMPPRVTKVPTKITYIIESLESLFKDCGVFNQDISMWDTSNIKSFAEMFRSAKAFNQPIGSWDVSQGKSFSWMFVLAEKFDQPIGEWDMSNAVDLSKMFYWDTIFNQDISKWNISNATNLSGMFSGSIKFNQPIGGWDTGCVTDISAMFSSSEAFNQDISKWDTSNVENMYMTFTLAEKFDQDLSDWNTSKVKDMSRMFERTSLFNQVISDWNTSNVTDMSSMFYGSKKFNQDISKWDVSNVVNNYKFSEETLAEWIDDWKPNFKILEESF